MSDLFRLVHCGTRGSFSHVDESFDVRLVSSQTLCVWLEVNRDPLCVFVLLGENRQLCSDSIEASSLSCLVHQERFKAPAHFRKGDFRIYTFKTGLCFLFHDRFSLLQLSEAFKKNKPITNLCRSERAWFFFCSLCLCGTSAALLVCSVNRSRTTLTEQTGAPPLSRVGEVGAVGDVGGDRRAPAEPSVTPPAARPPGGRPPQRLGAVPEGHQTGAPDTQAPAYVASL